MTTITENIRIERALEKELEDILAVQKSAFTKEAERHHNYDIPGLNQTREEISKEFISSLVLSAKLNDLVIGSVRSSCKDGVCTVSKLVVHPEYHNQGIGRKLLQSIEAESLMATPGINKFILFTAKNSFDNIGLYESEGYEKSGFEFVANGLLLIYLEKRI
jgi:ribosomal protein S18 acetylase RimI-like enzyme